MRNMKKIKTTDIFSYLSPQEISLEQLELIFLDSFEKEVNSFYTVFFDKNSVTLTISQALAVTELESSKKVAFICCKEKVIAIIGYFEL
jgi:hypothetical protein